MDIIKDEAFERIYKVDTFDKEYKKMFGKSRSKYAEELEQLLVNLDILDQNMHAALEREQFHDIKGHKQLYSIRHISETNPRVIFVFTQEDDAIVLLACALEKSTKDYDAAISRAEMRLHLLEED